MQASGFGANKEFWCKQWDLGVNTREKGCGGVLKRMVLDEDGLVKGLGWRGSWNVGFKACPACLDWLLWQYSWG